jgi:hypothetical protein
MSEYDAPKNISLMGEGEGGKTRSTYDGWSFLKKI